MRVKTVDREHLMVILSPLESDCLGIRPDMALQTFRVKFVISRIFAVACSCCNFSVRGERVDIRILLHKTGETILFFSEPKNKKYRLKEEQNSFICIFSDMDALISLMARIRSAGSPAEHILLFKQQEKYMGLVFPFAESWKNARAFFGEYAQIKRLSRLMLAHLRGGEKIYEARYSRI